MDSTFSAAGLIDAIERKDELVTGSWDAVETPVVALDLQGQVLLFNRACEELTGYGREGVWGRSAVDLFVAPEEAASVQATIERLLAGTPRAEQEISCVMKSGERRHVQWTGRSLQGAAGQTGAIVATGTDVTEWRRTEEERAARDKEIADLHEEVHKEIGQELHDTVVSNLAGLSMYASSLTEKFKQGALEASDLERLTRYLQDGAHQARQMAHRFSAVGVDRTRLAGALRALAEETEVQWEVPCSCEVQEEVELPADEVARHLYRIAQEAVANAVQHASPTQVEVRFRVEGDRLILEVADDGRGVPAEARAGVGMRSMRHRAERLGGELHIEPRPGGGTTVRCVAPRESSV